MTREERKREIKENIATTIMVGTFLILAVWAMVMVVLMFTSLFGFDAFEWMTHCH